MTTGEGNMPTPLPIYPTLQAFYDADQDRLQSPEADYGVHWRLDHYRATWRVSYVQTTGEIYALYQSPSLQHNYGRQRSEGPVFVLGIVPADPVPPDTRYGDHHCVYYATLDKILDGWPACCGAENSLTWVRDRIAAANAGLA